MALTSCGQPAPSNSSAAEPTRALANLDGFDEYKLGANLDSALTAGPAKFDQADVEYCLRTISIRGCDIGPDLGDAPSVIWGAGRYYIALSIKRDGRVSAITVRFRVGQDVTVAECEAAFAQTVDLAVERFGPFRLRSDGEGSQQSTSPQGNGFWRSGSGEGVTTFGILDAGQHDGRRASLVGLHMTQSDGPVCEVDLRIGDLTPSHPRNTNELLTE